MSSLRIAPHILSLFVTAQIGCLSEGQLHHFSGEALPGTEADLSAAADDQDPGIVTTDPWALMPEREDRHDKTAQSDATEARTGSSEYQAGSPEYQADSSYDNAHDGWATQEQTGTQPVADAGEDINAINGEEVTRDASGAYEPAESNSPIDAVAPETDGFYGSDEFNGSSDFYGSDEITGKIDDPDVDAIEDITSYICNGADESLLLECQQHEAEQVRVESPRVMEAAELDLDAMISLLDEPGAGEHLDNCEAISAAAEQAIEDAQQLGEDLVISSLADHLELQGALGKATGLSTAARLCLAGE